ncbi:uncharacterized protein [Periplaneta americana]|uniref:uncharacterized protein isoform X2 n=1 Tax=Periplaneta americana TaxID=6978 RepID=UPI0037E92891
MRKREWCADSNGNLPHLYIPRRYVENAMMSLSLVKNSGRKLSPQSDVRVGDTGEGHVMTQDTEEKKRRSTTATRDEKTPVLPARHDTTGKLMMLDAATQTSSSDHFEESSRRYAEWEEEVRLEELQHLQRVAIRLFDFSMYSDEEETTGPMMVYAASQTSSSDYLEEIDRQEMMIRKEGLMKLEVHL